MGPATHTSWPYWNIEHRRQFSNLKEGIHVPGYTGYMPQGKYFYGDRFAMLNEKLLPTQIIRRPLPPIPPKPKSGIRDPPPENGLNKYLSNMVPGYTGYIPHRLYNYGESYTDDCVTCIKQLQDDKRSNEVKLHQVKTHVDRSIHLKPIANENEVIEKLNKYNHNIDGAAVLNSSNKRGFLEAPKIGYTGFIPRMGVTEVSLGVRKSAADEAALKSFQIDQSQRRLLDNQPVNLDNSVDDTPTWAKNRKRIYTPGGLKPKFTGYVPHRRFVYGKTYGNMTREMSVCSHRKDTYGDHNTHRGS